MLKRLFARRTEDRAAEERSRRDALARRDLARDCDRLVLGPEATGRAALHGVSPAIHFDDFVFWATHDWFKGDLVTATDHYFDSGHTSARRLASLWNLRHHADRLEAPVPGPLRILDFASGYGCVTRHLGSWFPESARAASDIHPAACAFVAAEFSAQSHLSAARPEAFGLESQFDLVFALSFFSHLPEDRFGPWLARLAALVAPGGLLVFTTHGATSRRLQMPDLPLNRRGYGARVQSEQLDLSLDDYIQAVTLPRFVLAEIGKVPGMELVGFLEGWWWLNQDCFVLQRRA